MYALTTDTEGILYRVFEGFDDDNGHESYYAIYPELVDDNTQLVMMLDSKSFFLDQDEQSTDLIQACSQLTLAGNRDFFFNTNYEAGHDDVALRAVVGKIYFRRHMIADPDIAGLMMPASHPSRSANYELTRSRVMKWQNKVQGGNILWYFEGVTATCGELGGRKKMVKITGD